MEQTKKPAGKRSRGMPLGARAALVAAVVLAALFGIYALLCVWAGGSDRILPGVVCMTPEGEEIDLGGMTVEEADQALQASYGQAIEHCSLTVTAGEGVSHQLEGNLLTADTEAAARQALELTNQVPFLQRGISRIWGAGRQEVPHAGLTLSQEGETALDTLLDQLESELNTPAVESQYTLGEDSVEVILGTPGSALDRESAKIQILQALTSGAATLDIQSTPVEPQALTAQAIEEDIHVDAQPMSVGSDGTVTPPVVGISLNVEEAQAALDAAAPGETVSLPLVRTQPDYSQATEDGLLYQDKLSECITSIGGTSARLNNVKLATQKCNGVILMPGDTFDYNDVVGQRTAAAGFQAAPAYVGGQTVNEIGGGICQVSSSLYYCTVYANLEVVTRSNHRYAVGYVPDGLDATVSWGGPE